MTRAEEARRRQLEAQRDQAEREYQRLLRRREELAAREVRNEDRRGRFLLRLDGDIAEAHERMSMALVELEEYERC